MNAVAQTKQKSPTVAAVSSLQESRDVVKAFRSIDSRTASGLNFREYSREVGDLKLAIDALDEVLEHRKEQRLRDQLAQALAPYQEAKDVWALCTSGYECGYGIIAFGLKDDAVTKYAVRLLEKYPGMNAREDQGGVLMNEGAGPRIFYSRLLNALWGIGQQRSKAMRASLQP